MLKKLFLSLAAFDWIKLLRSGAATRGALYCSFIKKESLAQVLSCEFWEICKNIFFMGHLRATTSVPFKKIFTLHSVEVSSSPNPPLLFVIVLWDETNKSSLSQMKCLPTTLLKRDRCFPGKFAKLLKTHFSAEQLRWLLLNKPRRSLWSIVWWSDALVI